MNDRDRERVITVREREREGGREGKTEGERGNNRKRE